MENASKALIIAGGILLSMIVISLFFYMFGNMSTLVQRTEKDTTQEETVDFNKGFEAYNKKIMYGADIISVFNKATDNNIKYKATVDNENQEYFINIIINFKKDLGTRKETYTKNRRGTGYDMSNNTENIVFRKNNSYSLLNDKDKIQKLLIDAVSWVDQEDNKTYVNQDSSVSTYTQGCTSYTVTYYPASEFKRKIFYCNDMKYSKTSGRVIEMSFTEKE